jgi:sec-independent protein translocase protein TatA
VEALTPAHLALILLGFLLLFGYKKLPDAARAIGRSLRIFRSEMHALGDEDAHPAVDAEPGQAGSSPGRTSPAS